MTIRLTRWLALTVAALAANSVGAQTVTLKLHHFMPPGSTAQLQFIQPWCDKVAKESAGRLKCQIYPSMQLGGTPQQLFDQAKDGMADMVWTVPSYQTGRFPVSEAFDLPFMVSDAECASRGLWHYVNKNAAAEYQGVHPILFHVHDGSLLHTAKRPVRTLEDFRGLKLRGPTRQGTKMVLALGATPVSMPLSQTAEAVSKGVIDGALIPWGATPTLKFEEVTSFHTEPPAGAPKMLNTTFILAMNLARYHSLPPELKKVIDANSGPLVSAWAGKLFADDIEAGRKAAERRKNTIYTLPEAEFKRWQAVTARIADEWVNDMVGKGYDGKRLLAEARAVCK